MDDLEVVTLSDIKSEEKHCVTSLIGGIWKERMQMNLLIKQKETCRLREGTNSCLYTLLYLKMDNQQGPTM